MGKRTYLLAVASILAILAVFSGFESIWTRLVGPGPSMSDDAVHTASAEWTIAPPPQQDSGANGTFEGRVEVSDAKGGTRIYRFSYPDLFQPAMQVPDLLTDPLPEAAFAEHSPTLIEWQSCVNFESGLSLNRDEMLAVILRDPTICRMRAEGGDTSSAVIGVLWPAPNQQPLGKLQETCAAEALVWFEWVATAETDIAICLIVGDLDAGQSDVIVFERSEDKIITIATETGLVGLSWDLKSGRARPSHSLDVYALKQAWRNETETPEPRRAEAYEIISALTDRVRQDRILEFSEVELTDQLIKFHFTSRNDREVDKLIDEGYALGDVSTYAFFLLMEAICAQPLTQALAEYQYFDQSYSVVLYREDGQIRYIAPLSYAGCAIRE